MRMHINIDAKLVRALDKRLGRRKRSAYISELVRRALENEERWELINSAIGTISDSGHVWDPDPAAWVHKERRSDPRRVG